MAGFPIYLHWDLYYHRPRHDVNSWRVIKIRTPKNIIINHIVVAGFFLCSSTFINVRMRFNSFIGNISRKKSIRAILLVPGDPEKKTPNIVFNPHWQNGTGFSFIPSAYFFHFCPWHSTTISPSSPASSSTKSGRDGAGAIRWRRK